MVREKEIWFEQYATLRLGIEFQIGTLVTLKP